jgi:hypothetical protein
MKKFFSKPLFHFIPLADGYKAEDLATLTDAELKHVYQLSKAQEERKVYQANPDFVVTAIADEYLAVPTAEMAQVLNGMISLNRTGYFIWEQCQQPCSLHQLLVTAKAHFADEHHLLDMQLREYVVRFTRLALLKEIDKIEIKQDTSIKKMEQL